MHELLAALEANPDDRESYRVYADALQAAGDPRGALIAMQLAREETKFPVKARQLDEQIAQHFIEHADRLLGPLRRWTNDHMWSEYWTWRYGFIHALTLNPIEGEPTRIRDVLAERMRDVLPAVFAHPSGRLVRELRMSLSANHQELVDFVATHAPSTIHVLQLAISHGKADLSRMWRRLPNLTSVTLDEAGDHNLGTDELPNVREATLKDAAIVAALARWPMLETLSLRASRWADPPILEILHNPHLPRLAKLQVIVCSRANDVVAALASTPVGASLVELDLDGGNLNDQGAIAWAAKPPARRLKRLRVRNNDLTSKGIEALAAVAERVIARQKDEDP